MDEGYVLISKRFVRSLDGHPILLVGKKGKSYLGIECTHSRKRGHSTNRKFSRNPNPNDSCSAYWESRCIELGSSDIIDYSSWSLSPEDESRIDGFLKGNSKAKLHFQ